MATAICAQLRPEDVLFSTHRGHGHALAKGLAPRELAAELFGARPAAPADEAGACTFFPPKSA